MGTEVTMGDDQRTLLIVDDHRSKRRSLRTILATIGFVIVEATRGKEVLALVHSSKIDAVVIDIDLPGIGGIATCRSIRQLFPTMPILVLSARSSENDVVEAFDAGADDYIIKPFQRRVIIARLRAAMRWNKLPGWARAAIVIGDVSLDPERHEVIKGGQRIHLSPKQFEILHYLMEHHGGAVSHRKLIRKIRGPKYGDDVEYLRTYIRQLRVKIEDDPGNPEYLLTDSHFGYRFATGHSPATRDARELSLLLVGSEESFSGKNVARLVNSNRFRIVARSSLLSDVEYCMAAPGMIDVVLASCEYGEEELTTLAVGCSRRGFRGLILQIACAPKSTTDREPGQTNSLHLGDLVLDVCNRRVWVRGVEVRFERLEFDLLSFLCDHADQFVSRKALATAIGMNPSLPDQDIIALVCAVRAKIEETGTPQRYIVTQHRGYKFVTNRTRLLPQSEYVS
jgi:two-component system KDP operon response regulator KdpE